MKSVGIIAEYNPFHNGHAYQLQKAKEASGADFAVAVMSGDFVQRGEPAMFEKRLRAKWALENGADMVITLPTPFALASAEAFALGGVTLLSRSGIADSIAFGSECGDTDLLCRAADVLNNEPDELKALIRSNISRGLSYPDARARAFGEYLPPELASVFSSPNDILGIEYIRAIRRIDATLQPIAIGRTGVAHDSAHTCGGFTSASNIRRLIVSGESEYIKSYIPEGIYEDMLSVLGRTAPIMLQSLSRETVYALRRMSKEQLKSLPDVTEGLENLLYSACRKYADIGSVLTAVKSRRYTMARLKRICMVRPARHLRQSYKKAGQPVHTRAWHTPRSAVSPLRPARKIRAARVHTLRRRIKAQRKTVGAYGAGSALRRHSGIGQALPFTCEVRLFLSSDYSLTTAPHTHN